MTFKPYPKYKASGVEWLGDIPEGWDVLALKYVVSMQSGEQITAEDIDPYGDYPVFGGNGLRGYTSAFTHEGHYALIGRQGALCGNVNYASGRFWASEHAVVVSPIVSCSAIWLGELLRTMNLGQYSITAAQPGLSVDAIGKLRIPFAPIYEQAGIASFLERETAKIDTLIAKQEAMIELLGEKRQAVISHAVTKGLDPNIPMKSSGVAWLGEVPEHWKVTSVKRAINSIEQGWSPQCDGSPAGPDEWGVLKVGCVNNGTFKPEQNKSLPAELEAIPELGVTRGDLLISRANTRELVGSAAVVLDDYPKLMLCDKLYRLRVDQNKCAAQFVALFLGTSIVRNQIELAAGGASASMLNIAQGTILNLQIALPSVIEQLSILTSIECTTRKMDTLIANAQQAIALQKEHRTALISAAVTGKIDVRGEVKERQLREIGMRTLPSRYITSADF